MGREGPGGRAVTLRVAVAVSAVLMAAAPARAQEATLREVLNRSALYIVRMITEFTNVVAPARGSGSAADADWLTLTPQPNGRSVLVLIAGLPLVSKPR